jgi:hypothetical protein
MNNMNTFRNIIYSLKKILVFTIIIFVAGCAGPNIQLVKKISKEKTTDLKDDIKDADQPIKNIPVEEYVYLFFNRAFFIKTDNKNDHNDIQMPLIHENDFKSVIEFQIQGNRYIKLRNIKTGEEYIIKEGDKKGNVVLLERTLQYYKFKFNNTVIKVNR